MTTLFKATIAALNDQLRKATFHVVDKLPEDRDPSRQWLTAHAIATPTTFDTITGPGAQITKPGVWGSAAYIVAVLDRKPLLWIKTDAPGSTNDTVQAKFYDWALSE